MGTFSSKSPGENPAAAEPVSEPLFSVLGPMAAPSSPRTLPGVARLYAGHLSTQVMLLSATGLAALRLALGNWAWLDVYLLLFTLAAWPFVEWIFHVLIHLPPLRLGKRVWEAPVVRKHRQHHIDPTVLDYTLLPVSAVVALGTVSSLVFYLMLPLPQAVSAAICFHLAGLTNGWVHLMTHTRYAPKTRFFRWVRRTHALHHFKNERYWFAFVGPYADVLLGTYRNPKHVATSAACAGRKTLDPSP